MNHKNTTKTNILTKLKTTVSMKMAVPIEYSSSFIMLLIMLRVLVAAHAMRVGSDSFVRYLPHCLVHLVAPCKKQQVSQFTSSESRSRHTRGG